MSKPFTIVDSCDPCSTVFIPANQDMLAIARLYLEKYEVLSEADRELYRSAIVLFNSNGATQRYDGAEVKQ